MILPLQAIPSGLEGQPPSCCNLKDLLGGHDVAVPRWFKYVQVQTFVGFVLSAWGFGFPLVVHSNPRTSILVHLRYLDLHVCASLVVVSYCVKQDMMSNSPLGSQVKTCWKTPEEVACGGP